MTIKIGRDRRYFIAKNLIMMLVMAVLIILAVMAWFSFNKTVNANNIVVKAISTEIDIAESVKTYDENQDVVTDGPGEFGSSVEFNGPFVLSKDCTGDGEKLIVPEFNVAKDFVHVKQTGKEVNANLDPANAISNLAADKEKILHPDQDPPEYQFIQCEFYVRSKNSDLRLANDSQLLSRTEAGGGNLFAAITSSANSKKSAYGNFNVDGLVGAIRVALIGEGCTTCNQNWDGNHVIRTGASAPTTVRRAAQKQILWVPRPDVYLNVSEGSAIDNWTLLDSRTQSSEIKAITNKHSYYKKKDSGTGLDLVDPDLDGKTVVSTGTASNGAPCLGTNENITDFDYSADLHTISIVADKENTGVLEDYYITKYTMKIWIEGTDTEARRAMDGGEFDLTLSFL